MTTVWIDGQVVAPERAVVSVFDHGLLYGDGVFEGMRAVGGRLVDWDLHLERLRVSAKAIHLSLPSEAMLWEATRSCCLGEGKDTYLRLIVTRGKGLLGIDPQSCVAPSLIGIAASLSLYSAQNEGLHLASVSQRRPASDVLDPRVKSLNYLNNILAKVEAKQRGADDAVMYNHQGLIAEASAANIFIYSNSQLLTPPTTDGALDGITRRRVLYVARELGITAVERSLSRIDLFGAREAFVCGTGAGLVRVRRFDAEDVAPERTIFDRIQAGCAEYVLSHGRLLRP